MTQPLHDTAFKTVFGKLNDMKRSYVLMTAELNKSRPNEVLKKQHELEMLQNLLQLELAIRSLQYDYRKEVNNNERNTTV